MISKLRAWYLHRKAVKAELEYNRGFEYAAGQLMRFKHDPAALKRIRFESEGDGSNWSDQFHRGMRDAVDNFDQHFNMLSDHYGHSSFE